MPVKTHICKEGARVWGGKDNCHYCDAGNPAKSFIEERLIPMLQRGADYKATNLTAIIMRDLTKDILNFINNNKGKWE